MQNNPLKWETLRNKNMFHRISARHIKNVNKPSIAGNKQEQSETKQCFLARETKNIKWKFLKLEKCIVIIN